MSSPPAPCARNTRQSHYCPIPYDSDSKRRPTAIIMFDVPGISSTRCCLVSSFSCHLNNSFRADIAHTSQKPCQSRAKHGIPEQSHRSVRPLVVRSVRRWAAPDVVQVALRELPNIGGVGFTVTSTRGGGGPTIPRQPQEAGGVG